MKLLPIVLATALMLFQPAVAGDWGKAPVPAKAPIEECVDIGGSISSGYETDYVFYGARFSRDAVWTDVNYTFENFVVPINVGAWYLNSINGNTTLDELDLYLAAELGTIAGFDVTLAYTHFFFPENPYPSYGEIGLDLYRSLGLVDFIAEANYALLDGRGGFGSGAWYYQAGLEKSFGLTDSCSLVIGAGVGYSDNYYSGGLYGFFPSAGGGTDSGWNHYYATASLPIELNCRATLTPYISYTGAPDTWVVDGVDGGPGAQSDILHGGVSLSVSF